MQKKTKCKPQKLPISFQKDGNFFRYYLFSSLARAVFHAEKMPKKVIRKVAKNREIARKIAFLF